MAKIEYFFSKEFHKQIQQLRSRGGQFTKAANEATDIIMNINSGIENPFDRANVTHNGESRIKHCTKYDLPGYVRLVTIKDNGLCLLAYLGDKDDTERWLNSRKGLNLGIDPQTKQLLPVRVSEDISNPEQRIDGMPDYSEGRLYKKLKDHYFYKIADIIKPSQLAPFLEFDSTVDDVDFLAALDNIEGQNIQNVFFDVFSLLKQGDIDGAKNRILAFDEEITLVAKANKQEIASVTSNDEYLKITELEAHYLKTLLEHKDWYDWMLFLHPSQKRVVEADFNGPARLLGVSGSGKTCVLVHRAIRLAEKYAGEKVLILTLNKSLSKLIEKLVDLFLNKTDRTHLKEQIRIVSFWELCKEYLVKFNAEGAFTERIFNNKSDKYGESIDEIWEEFYTCKVNNNEAEILFSIHQTLLVRKVFPQEYLKQEFDWIRSAFSKDERQNYLTVEREGRFIPLTLDDRKLILQGLECWENKMVSIGVADYLSLASALYQHIDLLQPEYRCILVDEIQDFGTIELKLIRRLVTDNINDLFMCGDIAQQVYNKQHKINNAGITILPDGFLTILKNYRNSREILEAAFSVFSKNVAYDKLNSEDFQVLNPQYANFSTPKPFLRAGLTLKNELEAAYEYLKLNLDASKKEKGCIALCGYSMFKVSELGANNSIPVLDGEMDLSISNIFLSDLEQTKGFEFDKMIIVNCSKTVFPNATLPEEEWFREISKLYVAMTRAKKELVISYSDEYSQIFQGSIELFTPDNWATHVMATEKIFDVPTIHIVNYSTTVLDKLKGKEFLYHRKSIGISRELQNKLIENVAGKSVSTAGKKEGWIDIQELKNDINSGLNNPALNRVFGSSVFKELQNILYS